LFHAVISSLILSRYGTGVTISSHELRGSLVVESIKGGLAGETSLLGTSIPASGSLALLETELSNPAGVIVTARLRLQSLLEAILSLGVIKALGDVFAVRTARVPDVLVLDVAGSIAAVGRVGLARLGVGARGGRRVGSAARAGLARAGLSGVGARSRRGVGGATSAGVLGSG